MRTLGHRLTTAALALLLLLVALVTIHIPAAAASPAVADPAPQARWTVMVYMDGDNSLEPWITHDIDREMAAVGSSAEVQVIALADRGGHPGAADGGWKGARVFRVTKGMHATADQSIADWGNADMGSPQTLTDFVTWAKAAYPADHYALMMWDHGWGWWPGNTMKDVTSNDYLDMNELRAALQAFGGVDMAGMETCLGQTIEVQAEFRGFADALAGSEDSTGYTTFDYADILARLQADPGMSAAQLAVAAARSIRNGHDEWSLTGSAVALDWRWDRLAAAVSDLGWDLAVRLPGVRAELGSARQAAASPPQSYPEVRDLVGIAGALKARTSSRAVRRDCDRVLRWSRRCLLYEWSPKAEGAMHGTAIFWPAGPRRPAVFSQWVSFGYYLSQLTFTRLTYWGDFLTEWAR